MTPRSVVDELLEGPPKEERTMQTKTKFVVTTLVFAIVGLLLGPQTPLGAALWGAPAEVGDGPGPTSGQLAALVGVGLVQAVGFGVGVALLLFGFRLMRRLFATEGQTRVAQLAVAWSLLSWVPHSALHMTAGADFGKLVVIEVAFHVTLVLAAAALGWVMVQAAQARPAAPAPGNVPRAAATLSVVRRP